MKTLPLLAILTMALSLQGSKAKKDPRSITIQEYATLKSASPIEATKVTIVCRIVNADGTQITFPGLTTNIGKTVSAELSREFPYPLDYNLPELPDRNITPGAFPVTPAVPGEFETKELGDFLTLTPRIRGAFLEVNGTLISKTVDDTSIAGGEAFAAITDTKGRVVLTENKAVSPEFQTIESTIRICGSPGIEHKIHLNSQNRDVCILTKPFKDSR